MLRVVGCRRVSRLLNLLSLYLPIVFMSVIHQMLLSRCGGCPMQFRRGGRNQGRWHRVSVFPTVSFGSHFFGHLILRIGVALRHDRANDLFGVAGIVSTAFSSSPFVFPTFSSQALARRLSQRRYAVVVVVVVVATVHGSGHGQRIGGAHVSTRVGGVGGLLSFFSSQRTVFISQPHVFSSQLRN